ncbi:N-acetyl sugar amidotransferase [Sphingomonas lacunae]|uniref:N-acetyl sugar amidotransferase n=1 Tax=Sphingomonas lacunae TaxID=2698828 RepID=A0A6M4AUF1_9SPHN|nr:N-acetyl sugar amidotransferase [Sphingomonas lacunae]QJQ32767.1 N-acetyl sugar amidotransferase [Sphingomonas lacunae]
MKIAPSPSFDLTPFELPAGQRPVFYGLPPEVRFCVRCNMSNQQPMSTNEYRHTGNSRKTTMQFDADGVCDACRFNDLKRDGEIDWDERERELLDLCDQHRKNDGSYDCIVGGSGGKDSAMQSHLLKYKYGMHPLTVTWSPHLYTDIGWKNFQNWLHVGGFDNFLYTPNGKIHRLLTREATINLLHPFQPFILGQKTFVAKMAAKLNIPLIFYGEMPGEYGEKVSHKESGYSDRVEGTEGEGFSLDYQGETDLRDMLLGGRPIGEYLDQGVQLADLMSYVPITPQELSQKHIFWKYLGYYVKWVPQEAYYYAVENTGFEANPLRTEGTYSKYNSLDDKVDGFFYYTRWIKFGVGRAMMDSAQEVRNQHITREEGIALIDRYEGEYPARYESEFLDYVGMTRDEFFALCDRFRSPHLWMVEDGAWRLRHRPGLNEPIVREG